MNLGDIIHDSCFLLVLIELRRATLGTIFHASVPILKFAFYLPVLLLQVFHE